MKESKASALDLFLIADMLHQTASYDNTDIEDLPKSGPVEDYDEELYKEFLKQAKENI